MSVDEGGHDPVHDPAHYAGDGRVGCKRAMLAMAAGYDRARVPSAASYWAMAATKHLWRWPLKGGVQDLEKARERVGLAIEAARAGKESAR